MLKSQAASLDLMCRSTPHLSAQRRIEAPTYTVDGTPKYTAEAAKQRRTIRSPPVPRRQPRSVPGILTRSQRVSSPQISALTSRIRSAACHPNSTQPYTAPTSPTHLLVFPLPIPT